MPFIPLYPGFSVSPQLQVEDITKAAEEGVTMIINNRPDGEVEGQPSSAAMATAAATVGLAYRYIPLTHVTAAQIQATRAALAEATGPVLAYCRSGTRSTTLWACAQAGELGADAVIEAAAAAGYDLAPLRRMLTTVAEETRTIG